MTHAIVHRLLWEYLEALCELENEVEREVLWREMFQAYAFDMPLRNLDRNPNLQLSGCSR